MSEVTRRDWLALAGASYMAGVPDLEAAQHVHNTVAGGNQSEGPYAPKFFKAHEYGALQILAGLIVPADSESKGAPRSVIGSGIGKKNRKDLRITEGARNAHSTQ